MSDEAYDWVEEAQRLVNDAMIGDEQSKRKALKEASKHLFKIAEEIDDDAIAKDALELAKVCSFPADSMVSTVYVNPALLQTHVDMLASRIGALAWNRGM